MGYELDNKLYEVLLLYYEIFWAGQAQLFEESHLQSFAEIKIST